ncbi:MAG: hypothetical protein RL011_1822 [Pseudomonadota bacterium]|jgi:hypothetical protein
MLLPLAAVPGRRLFSFLTIISSLMLAACSSDYKVVKVKQYRMALTQGDSSFKSMFESLINDYNKAAGSTVLIFENDPAKANCSIAVIKNLVNQDTEGVGTGKVGLGQWVTQSKAENPLLVVPGDKPTETVYYSMNVQFDFDYMKDGSTYERQKLFYHEVGHGLELDHTEVNESDVMYPDVGVGDPKSFDSYFQYVRSYMAS